MTNNTIKKTKKNDNLKANEKKWSKPLMEAGWTAIPSILIEQQHKLGLDPIDINIILQLASFWWYQEKLPHPSKKRIAERLNIDPSTVRKHIAAMEKKGYIKRNYRNDERKGQRSNEYTLEGLIQKATPYAKEAIAEKKKQRDEKNKRISRPRSKAKQSTEPNKII